MQSGKNSFKNPIIVRKCIQHTITYTSKRKAARPNDSRLLGLDKLLLSTFGTLHHYVLQMKLSTDFLFQI